MTARAPQSPPPLEARVRAVEEAVDFLRGRYAVVDASQARLTKQVDEARASLEGRIDGLRKELVDAVKKEIHDEMVKAIRVSEDRVLRASSAGLEDKAAVDATQNARLHALEQLQQAAQTVAQHAQTAGAAAQVAATQAASAGAVVTAATEAAKQATQATTLAARDLAMQGPALAVAISDQIQRMLPSRWRSWGPAISIAVLILIDLAWRELHK